MPQNPFDHRNQSQKSIVVQVSYEQWNGLLATLTGLTESVNAILNQLNNPQPRPAGFGMPIMFSGQNYYGNAAMNYARNPGNRGAQQFAFAYPGAMASPLSNPECCTDQLNTPIGPEASIEIVAFPSMFFKHLKEKYHVQYVGQLATTTFKNPRIIAFVDNWLKQYRYHTGMRMPLLYPGEEDKYYVLNQADRDALSNVSEQELDDALKASVNQFVKNCNAMHESGD